MGLLKKRSDQKTIELEDEKQQNLSTNRVKRNLKRVGAGALATFSVFTFAACGRGETTDVDSNTDVTTEQTNNEIGETENNSIYNQLLEQINSANYLIGEMQEEIENLKTQSDQASSQIAELQEQSNEASSQITALNSKIEELTNLINSLKDEISAIQSLITLLKNKTDFLDVDLEAIEKAVDSAIKVYENSKELFAEINQSKSETDTDVSDTTTDGSSETGETEQDSTSTDSSQLSEVWEKLGSDLYLLKISIARTKAYSSCTDTLILLGSDLDSQVSITYSTNVNGDYIKRTTNDGVVTYSSYYDSAKDTLYDGNIIYYSGDSNKPDNDSYSQYLACLDNGDGEASKNPDGSSYRITTEAGETTVTLDSEGSLKSVECKQQDDSVYTVYISGISTDDYASNLQEAGSSNGIGSLYAHNQLESAKDQTFSSTDGGGVSIDGTWTSGDEQESVIIVAGDSYTIQTVSDSNGDLTLAVNYNADRGTTEDVWRDENGEIVSREYTDISGINAEALGESLIAGISSGATWEYDDTTGILKVSKNTDEGYYSYKFTIKDGVITEFYIEETSGGYKYEYYYDITVLSEEEYKQIVEYLKEVIEAFKSGDKITVKMILY